MAEGLSEEALKTIVDNVVAKLQESNTAATRGEGTSDRETGTQKEWA